MAKSFSHPRILPQRGGLRLSDQQRRAATIWYNWYAGGGAPASTLLDGLIHVWHLDETGTSTSDLRMDSVGDVHLTPTATLMTQADGVHGKSYTNDGSARLLYVDSDDLRNIVNGSFSFCCWAKFNTTTLGMVLFGIYSSEDRSYFVNRAGTTGLLGFYVSEDGSTSNIIGPVEILDNDFHFVYAHYNKGTNECAFSVDNGELHKGTYSLRKSSSTPFRVGSHTTNYINGQIDELYCWNRVLTDDERSLLYSGFFFLTMGDNSTMWGSESINFSGL